jgi:HAD superfamily hydrolase (TIGR01509 family)
VSETLQQLMARVRCVLLDFDGPVCSVFAGWPAPEVAESVRSQLLAEGLPLGEAGKAANDPLEVLRNAHDCSRAGGRRAEHLLTAAELACVETAAPTPGAEDLLRVAARRCLPVAVVSNNSAPAVHAYLERHSLSGLFAFLSTRDPDDSSLMKPNPYLLHSALSALGFQPTQAVMVGDSVGDILAAKSSGVSAVAYANRPIKVSLLKAAGADHIICSMRDLVLDGTGEDLHTRL